MTDKLIIKRAEKLISETKYDDAISILTPAVEKIPKSETLWSHLIYAFSEKGDHQKSAELGRIAVVHHPESVWLWRKFGGELTEIGSLEEAEAALNRAESIEPFSPQTIRFQIALYQKQNKKEKVVQGWELIKVFDEPSSNDLNLLGIAYWELQPKNCEKAIENYRLSYEADPTPSPMFNMGLAFEYDEISQDIDAADAYKRALGHDPAYDPAIKGLQRVQKKLIPLAISVNHIKDEMPALLEPKEHYKFYISPFEAFKIEPRLQFDIKEFQSAKKRLTSEMELNDGIIEWLENYELDKSLAFALEGDLFDTKKYEYHSIIYKNKKLLRFLTHGDIKHFLYDDDDYPMDILEHLNSDHEFKAFLSKIFSSQYDFVLTRALKRNLLPAIEVLFDGRRWALPEHNDICFKGAHQFAEGMVKVMQTQTEKAKSQKTNSKEVDLALKYFNIPEVFNLLPAPFRTHQTDLVASIRSMSIDCANQYGDYDTSKAILDLCHKFKFKNISLNEALKKDFSIVENLIKEERKNEVFLKQGEKKIEITKEGIRYDGTYYPVDHITALKWGITVLRDSGIERLEYEFGAKNNSGDNIGISWKTIKADESSSSEYFNSMVRGAMSYIAESVVNMIQKKIFDNGSASVGTCTFTKEGASFETQGTFFKKNRSIPWADIDAKLVSGYMVISSKRDSRAAISLDIRDTYNAVLIPFLVTSIIKPN